LSQEEVDGIDYRGTNEGSKLAGRADLWIGNDDLDNNPEFGTSGFTALSGGYRSYEDGYYFSIMGDGGDFWSSTESSSSNAWYRALSYSSSDVYRNNE
jgi:uncharacterized protein (TIGR02145 family)